jgi:hypothetical protein
VNAFGSRLTVTPQGAPNDLWDFLPLDSPGDNPQQLPAGEALEQLIVERNDRLVAARIALASSPSVQLAIDAMRFVILRKDDMQAACLRDGGVQLYVGAAASHVSGDGHSARLPGAGDDLGLLAVLSRIQYDRLQPCFVQQSPDMFGSADRARRALDEGLGEPPAIAPMVSLERCMTDLHLEGGH